MKNTCENCAYSHKDDELGMLFCRRNPPQVIAHKDYVDGICGIFPNVDADDWCGEFKPKANNDIALGLYERTVKTMDDIKGALGRI